MKRYTSSCILVSLLACVASNAAIVANGDFETAVSTSGTGPGTTFFYLDESTGNIQKNDDGSVLDSDTDVDEWVQQVLASVPDYSATGGNGGGGGFVMDPATNLNNKPRAIMQFVDDGKATTGVVSITLDFKFNLTGTGMFGNIELYGWNDGQTGPELSAGGPNANDPTYNVTNLGDATNLLGGTGVQIAASSFTADEWGTATIASSLDLGTGYDFYAWRVGIVGADGPNDLASFDNLIVIPEPGAFALIAGLLGLSFVMLRRR